MQLVSIAETLYCHSELDSGCLNTLIYIDPERDAETEGPEFSSGSIQQDIFQDLVQPACPTCLLAGQTTRRINPPQRMAAKIDIFRHFSFPQEKLIMNKGNEQIPLRDIVQGCPLTLPSPPLGERIKVRGY